MFIKVHKKADGEKVLINATQIDVIRANAGGSDIFLVTQDATDPVTVRESLDEIENSLADMALIAVQPTRGEYV